MPTTQQLTPVAKNSQGNVLTGRTFTWASLNPSVATVDSNGLVTSVAPGSAVITATTGGVTGSANVTVNPPVTPTFGFGASLANFALARSASTEFSLPIIRANGHVANINLSALGLPSGVSVGFSTSPGASSPPSSLSVGSSVTTVYVKLTATGSAALGVFALNIVGNATSLQANRIIQIAVSDTATPGIVLSPTQTTATCSRGGTVNIPLTLLRNGGYTGNVTMNFPNQGVQLVQPGNIPVFITGSFSDGTLTGAENETILTLSVPVNYPAGPVQVIAQATGSGVDSAGTFINLTVV